MHVCDLTHFRYDSNIDIPETISTENDRVSFLKAIAQLVVCRFYVYNLAKYFKARIKLNLKRLYGADGYAVKELLKVASLLNQAHTMAGIETVIVAEDTQTKQMSSSKFLDNVKMIRNITTELTENGATLYDLLEKETDLRVCSISVKLRMGQRARQGAIAVPHNMEKIKAHIVQKNQETTEMITSLTVNNFY